MIKPFKIYIGEEKLNDLKTRIRSTRWPDVIAKESWNDGAGYSYMQELVNYWLNEFDWRKTEDALNTFPNFIASIKGYDIHFLHIKSHTDNAIPLLITHGWPYSVLEMVKLIPLLSQKQETGFDLIIPSMLGYGFSQKVNKPGCNSFLMADLWHELMMSLGYVRFGMQGGDFGAGISSVIAYKYPHSVIGMHLNYIPGLYEPVLESGDSFSEEEKTFLRAEEDWYKREGGYSHEQRTRPLTLAYGLNDSPVGLCAWIVEKMKEWADCKGNIEAVFTKNEILSNITLYWLTETIHSSIRLYNENSLIRLRLGRNNKIRVPLSVARFKYEEPFPPRQYIERGFEISKWSEFPAGGHFPAMEQPELLANDIREFFITTLSMQSQA